MSQSDPAIDQSVTTLDCAECESEVHEYCSECHCCADCAPTPHDPLSTVRISDRDLRRHSVSRHAAAVFPRYFRNRIGFAPTTDGKIIFLIRVDKPREGWLLFTDGTQRLLDNHDHVEDWCQRMAEDPSQTMAEVPRHEAERLVEQNRGARGPK